MKKRFADEQIIGFLQDAEAGTPVKNLLVIVIKQRFGKLGTAPRIIEFLTDSSFYETAKKVRDLPKILNAKPVTTPIESPQSHGIAEAL